MREPRKYQMLSHCILSERIIGETFPSYSVNLKPYGNAARADEETRTSDTLHAKVFQNDPAQTKKRS